MRDYRATASLIAALALPTTRWEAAQNLARHLRARELVIFIRDPEVDALLPAPGFPQTLPPGRAWRTFVADCIGADQHHGDLPPLNGGATIGALGIAAGRETVLVLLGGAPNPAEVEVVRTLLPLLAAAFHGERAARSALAQARLAQESARQATALAEALDRARRDLERSMRTRADFLTSASHDLKNPLAAIKGTAQLMHRRAVRAGTPETDRLVQGLANIDATATQMTALIDDLLDVTRHQMERPLLLERREVDLVALARRVVDALAGTTERHCLTVVARVRELVGSWDARRIERVLGNVIGNAIKYSPDGGDITITVAEERGADGGWAVIAVADQGVGIPDAEIPLVFKRFHRASNVVDRIGGTGIGLASVQQTVESHGGKVSIASQEGRGTTIVVRLPLAPAVNAVLDARVSVGNGTTTGEGRP